MLVELLKLLASVNGSRYELAVTHNIGRPTFLKKVLTISRFLCLAGFIKLGSRCLHNCFGCMTVFFG